jgi:SAM-dependent methyltransferase
MAVVSKSIADGHFAKKQILSKDRLIAWTHGRRFNLGLELAQEFASGRVLDYGCGDGTFLAMLMETPKRPARGVGAELLRETVVDCQNRIRHETLDFVLLDELDNPKHRGAYDAIICMEVLEHMVDVEPILDRFAKLLAPSGKLLISVPVETGLPLLVKQGVRRVAGWRGIGDYPGTSPYTLKEICIAVFGGSRASIVRPVHTDAEGGASHDHKGFNWMAFRRLLSKRFHIESTLGSPLTWLTPHLASQVWFIASPKTEK